VLQPFHSSVECVARPDECDESALAGRPLPPRVDHALKAWRMAREEGEPCGPNGGELSSLGWQQLQSIGEAMAGAYATLLDRDDPNTTALQVVSTDTGRTALSATAMTRGLLHGAGVHTGLPPNEAGAAGGDAADDARDSSDAGQNTVRIHPTGGAEVLQGDANTPSDTDAAQPAEVEEVLSQLHAPTRTTYYSRQEARQHSSRHADRLLLHGTNARAVPQLRLPLRLHVLQRPDDPMMAGVPVRIAACPAAAALERDSPAARAFFQTPPPIAARIAALAGVEASEVPTTEQVADDIYTRLCHGEALPCWGTLPEGAGDAGRVGETDAGARGPAAAHTDSLQQLQPPQAHRARTAGDGRACACLSDESLHADAAAPATHGVGAVQAQDRAQDQAQVQDQAQPQGCGAQLAAVAAASVQEHLQTDMAWAPACARGGPQAIHGAAGAGGAAAAADWSPSELHAAALPLWRSPRVAPAALNGTLGPLHSDWALDRRLAALTAHLPQAGALHGHDGSSSSGSNETRGSGGSVVVPATAGRQGSDSSDSESESGSSGVCLDVCDAVSMLERAELAYSNRFAQPFIRLMLFPFLRQVLGQLRDAAAGRAGHPRIVLRAAHDTVLAPLLTTLGWSHRPFPWPGYASRVIIELWRAPDTAVPAAAAGGNANGPAASDLSAAEAAAAGGGRQSDDQFLVRFLYNGEDFTQMTACGRRRRPSTSRGQGERRGSEAPVTRAPPELWPCTLRAFADIVDGLVAPHTSWEEACRLPGVATGDAAATLVGAGPPADDSALPAGAAPPHHITRASTEAAAAEL
jgi:hypothetical protein